MLSGSVYEALQSRLPALFQIFCYVIGSSPLSLSPFAQTFSLLKMEVCDSIYIRECTNVCAFVILPPIHKAVMESWKPDSPWTHHSFWVEVNLVFVD